MIIDEKGRLYGKINVFDLLVLIVLLVMLYLGISLALALRGPSLEITAIAPEQIQKGTVSEIELSLTNDRQVVSGQVRLVPANFTGETVQLTPTFGYGERKKLTFTPPPNLPPGQYQVELELITQDALRRKSTDVARTGEKLLSVLECRHSRH